MLGFEIKIVFEPAGPGDGEICKNCNREIKGEKYAAIMQFGRTEQLKITDLNFFVCEKCKEKWS